MSIFSKTHRWYLYAIGLAVITAILYIALFLQHKTAIAPAKESTTSTVTRTTATCKGSMLFMGDTMLARSIGEAITAGKNPFAFVDANLKSASLRIANIETTIADPSQAVRANGKLYTFNAPLKAIETLQQAYINVSVLANNHTSDFGPSGTLDMLAQFTQAGLPSVGAGATTATAFKPLIVDLPLECEGRNQPVKVGFIAANDIENSFTKVGDSRAGSAYFDVDRLKASIQQAREEGATFVIAIPHWGIEYQATPTARQVEWGHWFIDHGVDAVIGGHPHVIQPTETYNDKPIIYSLGNFIFDQMQDSGANEGQMITIPVTQTITFEKDEAISRTTPQLEKPLPIPYRLNADGFPVPRQ